MRVSLLASSWLVIGCHAAPPPVPPEPTPPAIAAPTMATPASATTPPPPHAPPPGVAGRLVEIEPLPPARDARTLCAAYVARAAHTLRESGGWAHLHPTPPRCRESRLPVPFRGDETFRGARAFALDSGLDTELRLVVELPSGLALTPVSWGYENIHAAEGEPLPGTLESLQLEGGALVAVVGRTEGRRAPDADSIEMVLVRGAVVCRAAAGLVCHAYYPEAPAPLLGLKRRPWGAATPWSTLAWNMAPSFTFSAAGQLVVGH